MVKQFHRRCLIFQGSTVYTWTEELGDLESLQMLMKLYWPLH